MRCYLSHTGQALYVNPSGKCDFQELNGYDWIPSQLEGGAWPPGNFEPELNNAALFSNRAIRKTMFLHLSSVETVFIPVPI